MTYNVVQKIRDNYYLYEVTAEWDPETKRSKQRRRYVGKCDKDGNLVSSDRVEVSCLDFGEHYLMFNVCRRCGLWDALREVYGEGAAEIMFCYGEARAIRKAPPTQNAYVIKDSCLPEFFGIPRDSSILTMQGLMGELPALYSKREDLFRALGRGCESAVVYDIDVLKSPISFYRLFGTSSHFSFDQFPQRSIFVAARRDTGLPFYFRMANYQGADRSTLKAIAGDLSDMGVRDTTFCLRGYYTESEVERVVGTNYSTIISIRSDSPLAQGLIRLEDGTFDTVVHEGSVYRAKHLERTFGINRCDVYVVEDTRRRDDRTLAFYSKLEQFESTVSRMTWGPTIEDRIVAEHGFGDLLRFFKLRKGDDGRVSVKRNKTVTDAFEATFGMSVIVTNSDYGIEDMLGIIQDSGYFEQDLTIFRTDLQGGAPMFPSNESALGSLIVEFVGMVMKSALNSMVEASDVRGRRTYLDAISECSGIKLFVVNGKARINPLSFDQRGLFEALHIEPPSQSTPLRYADLRGRGRARSAPEPALHGLAGLRGRAAHYRQPLVHPRAGAGPLDVRHAVPQPGALVGAERPDGLPGEVVPLQEREDRHGHGAAVDRVPQVDLVVIIDALGVLPELRAGPTLPVLHRPGDARLVVSGVGLRHLDPEHVRAGDLPDHPGDDLGVPDVHVPVGASEVVLVRPREVGYQFLRHLRLSCHIR